MTGVFKTILILVVIYYAWKLLFRLFFPVMVKKVVNKAQQNMEDRMRQAYEQQQGGSYANHEGDVIIQKGAERKKTGSISDSDGEYVEFEEIKE
ncbi:MAG: DUF4834 family protein [Flavobacteriales bacterium]|nr:DUF4834 family protein [Flavobacteriales bacterium]